MLRIVYLHQYFRTPDMAGGTRSYEMSKRFAEAGHEVHVVTSDTSGEGPAWRWRQETVGDVTVHWLPVRYANEQSVPQRIIAFIKFAVLAGPRVAKLRPDVILATSTPLTIAVPAAVARLWTRAPIVFEVRDLWPELPIAVGALRNPLAKGLASALEWFAYHVSSRVVALSPGMADGVARRGIPRDHISVVPNSADNEMFRVDPAEGLAFRQELGVAADVPLVIYGGTFGRINGVGYIARLARAMHDLDPAVQFLAVGGGAEESAVREEAARLGVLDINLRVLGQVPKRRMPAILSAADATCSFFLPIKEMEANSANKFFDGLASGRPVVLNYAGWQADIVRESGAGVVLPYDDPRAAAQKLLAFLRDDAAVQQARRAAARLADTEFDRDVLAQQLLDTVVEASGTTE